MSDISGPSLFDSFESVGPPSFSENKSPHEGDANGTRGHRDCVGCKTSKSSSEFYKNSKGGYRKHCKECWKTREQRRKARIPKAKQSAAFKRWRRENRAKALLGQAKYRARQKGMYYDLDSYAAEIQGVLDAGVCELTGIPFNFDGGKTWDSPSLDRIDSTKGYFLTNVRVVLYCVNVMANLWGENKIVQIADAIMSRRRDHSANFQHRLESALKQQIDLNCSPEYELIWRRVVMSSGPPIYRLRASARRTSGNACSGWPTPQENDWRGPNHSESGSTSSVGLATKANLAGWPTPLVSDKKSSQIGNKATVSAKGWVVRATGLEFSMALCDVAQLAGWPTPMAGSPGTEDYNPAGNTDSSRKTVELAGWSTPRAMDGAKGAVTETETTIRRVVRDNANLVEMALASGPPMTSSPAGTARSGVLNPEHSRWLMGFPAVWGCCGALAMRLSRKSPHSSSGRSSKSKRKADKSV